jgi:hypothetical protein
MALKPKSPATRRYLLRMLVSTGAYLAILSGVAWASRAGQLPQGPLRYALAAAPALPVLGVIWAMLRFTDEEEDEYQRYLHNRAILWAMALTLLACVVWGLMQRYAGADVVNLLDVFNFFWISLLVTTAWVRLRAHA